MRSPTQSMQDFGIIKNRHKILSDDYKGFHPKILKEVTGLPLKNISEHTGFARARLYEDVVIPKPSSEIMLKIIHVVIALDEAYELMSNNANAAVLWINSPNAAFLGYSPFEVCMQGRGVEVIEWLRVRTGKVPGVGF